MTNERTAEEWGRVAVGLPGFRWDGMPVWRDDASYPCRGLVPKSDRYVEVVDEVLECCGETALDWRYVSVDNVRINPDDPATWGCFMELLGPGWSFTCPAYDARNWRLHGIDTTLATGGTLVEAPPSAAPASSLPKPSAGGPEVRDDRRGGPVLSGV